MAARYQRLKAEGRCVQCAEKLTADARGVRCARCYEVSCTVASGRAAARSARFSEQLNRVIETASEMNPLEQATLLGVDIDRIYCLRATARRRGHDLPNLGTPTKYHSGGKWDSVEKAARMVCERCGLRGFHECLVGHADDRRMP